MKLNVNFDYEIETDDCYYEVTGSVTGRGYEEYDGDHVEFSDCDMVSIIRIEDNGAETKMSYDNLPPDVITRLDELMLETLAGAYYNPQDYDDGPSDSWYEP